ncbi:MAG TPA: hypothetical protein VFU15_06560 [Bacteroidia bacterium]|nr:hypothetical protein [Bacteroidia bacterium]
MKKLIAAFLLIAFSGLTLVSCKSKQHCDAYQGSGSIQPHHKKANS